VDGGGLALYLLCKHFTVLPCFLTFVRGSNSSKLLIFVSSFQSCVPFCCVSTGWYSLSIFLPQDSRYRSMFSSFLLVYMSFSDRGIYAYFYLWHLSCVNCLLHNFFLILALIWKWKRKEGTFFFFRQWRNPFC
jgi:hypothetical protein